MAKGENAHYPMVNVARVPIVDPRIASYMKMGYIGFITSANLEREK